MTAELGVRSGGGFQALLDGDQPDSLRQFLEVGGIPHGVPEEPLDVVAAGGLKEVEELAAGPTVALPRHGPPPHLHHEAGRKLSRPIRQLQQ